MYTGYTAVTAFSRNSVGVFVFVFASVAGWLSSVFHGGMQRCKHTALDLRQAPCAVQYAFNLFSHNSPMTGNGYNEEEMKMVNETHKIWGQKDVNITATCIRVPVMRAHAESINLEFDRDISEEEVGFTNAYSG